MVTVSKLLLLYNEYCALGCFSLVCWYHLMTPVGHGKIPPLSFRVKISLKKFAFAVINEKRASSPYSYTSLGIQKDES